MIWHMKTVLLYSNRRQRIEKDGNTETGCPKPALQRKTMMMMMMMMHYNCNCLPHSINGTNHT